ncbi:autotransporter outer membrane beta-barrel domain-containing protein [Paraburkholderia diazotrophica]|uniref:autotransporter outer membrane beta-barrel domain-containing protein n=1 Tax=Paraburkholderia diazotrophica TaxID=667676 RepID=UPI0031735AF1
MNTSFKTIWNEALGAWVAASELDRTKSRHNSSASESARGSIRRSVHPTRSALCASLLLMGIGTPLEQVCAQTAISLTAASPSADIGSTTQTINGLTVANGVNGVISGAGGTLIYSGGPAFILGSTTSGQTQNLNMSGLTNFMFNNASQSFEVGGRFTGSGTNAANTAAALALAPNSVITASAFNVATIGNPASNGVRNVGTVTLGASTVINADTVNVGAAGKTSGTLALAAGGNLVLRGTDGASPVANWNIGTVNSSSVASTIGNVDLSAGSLDAKVTNLLIGQAIAGNGKVGTATLTLGSGTLDATSIVVGSAVPGARNGEIATLTIGNATVRTGTLTVGDDASTAGLIATVNLNNGGALLAQTIAGGAGNASRIFNWTNGTIGNEASGQNMTVSLASLALSGSGPHIFDIEGSTAVAGVSSLLSGTGALTKQGAGTLVLTAANAYTGGTTIQDGTVRISGDGNLGATSGGLTLDGGTLEASASMTSARNVTLASTGTFLTDTGTTLTLTGPLSGAGNMTKAGSGTLAVLGTGSYAGGTTIAAGTLQLGNGGTSGSITGDVVDNGVLAFDRSDTNTFGGVISGSGAVNQIGSGTTILTGTNTYTGSTSVTNGSLIVDGNQSAATGLTSVLGGGTIGGAGTIGGSVVVASGGALNPGDPGTMPGTLTIGGDLALASGSTLNYRFGEPNVPGGAYNDLTNVGGNLTLAGTLNVTTTSGGSFGPGVYRVFNYGGTLTDNGLTVGTAPSPDYLIQTSVAKQVNLVNTAGLALNYWDGGGTSMTKNDRVIEGGDGTWTTATTGSNSNNWTTPDGSVDAPYAQGAFAVFEGAPGTVTVDNSLGQVQAAGMQFATNGYHLTGGPIELTGGLSGSIVRVGDGTITGTGYTVAIDNVLTGKTRLIKTDLGTLVLNGNNTYTGGTDIQGGTVRVSSDANLGAASGGLTLDGGTLETTANMTSARNVSLASTGTFVTDPGTTLALDGTIAGSGSITKAGAGTLLLAGAGTQTGDTVIAAGTLKAAAANVLSPASAMTVQGGATLDLNDFDQTIPTLTNAGTVALSGAPGTTLTVSGNYMGAGGGVRLSTLLNQGGAAASTDMLRIGGNASGDTSVRINGSGSGAQTTGDGIRVVQVSGTSGTTAFRLAAPVQAGAYEYLLYRGGSTGANDWYLRSELEAQSTQSTSASTGVVASTAVAIPAYRPAVTGYAMTPSLNLDYGFSVLGTLHERVGDIAALEGTQPGHGDGVWARIGGRDMDMNGNERFSSNARTLFAQFGKDWTLSRTDAGGSTHAGATVTLGTSSASFADSARGVNPTLSTSTGTLTSQAQSLGGYWTRYFADHAYVDAVAQLTHYHDKYGDAYGGSATQNGFGAAGSLEVGKPWLLGPTAVAIEPQAQLEYQYLHLNDFNDGVSPVSGNTSNALRGRLGFRVFRANLENDNRTSAATPYLTVNVLHDFFAPGATTVGSTPFAMAPAKTWYELGAGVTASLGKASELYVAVSYARNVGGEYRRTVYGQGGYRYSW